MPPSFRECDIQNYNNFSEIKPFLSTSADVWHFSTWPHRLIVVVRKTRLRLRAHLKRYRLKIDLRAIRLCYCYCYDKICCTTETVTGTYKQNKTLYALLFFSKQRFGRYSPSPPRPHSILLDAGRRCGWVGAGRIAENSYFVISADGIVRQHRVGS